MVNPLLNFGFQHYFIFQGGDVLLDGAHFDRVPREGITISTWVKLDTNKGIQSIFDTVGSHSKHKDGQYHFEIENGKVRWFHRNENHDTIFSLLTQPTIREGVWTQITATYSASKQRARVSVFAQNISPYIYIVNRLIMLPNQTETKENSGMWGNGVVTEKSLV